MNKYKLLIVKFPLVDNRLLAGENTTDRVHITWLFNQTRLRAENALDFSTLIR